jgi:hypothetical protein
MRKKTRVLEVASIEGLGAIRRNSLDVVAWVRQLAMGDWLQRLANEHPIQVDETVDGAHLDWGRWLTGIPASARKTQFVDDLAQLASTYSTITKCKRLRVQLAAIDSQKCPKFHVDSVGIRLLCTYCGAGTEVIDEQSLDRARVSVCGPERAPTRETGAVRQMQPCWVALLKGSAWPGNEQYGAVHRSPVAGDRRRLVFTLDSR